MDSNELAEWVPMADEYWGTSVETEIPPVTIATLLAAMRAVFE